MCIDRGFRRNLGVPVKELIAVRRGVPVVEGVARLGRVGRSGDLLILHDCLIRRKRRRAVFVHKVDRVVRRAPLCIEHHVLRRHRGEGVSCGQSGIGIPTFKCIIAVYAALCCGRRPDVRRLVDVRIKLNILNRVKLVAAVVVINLEYIAIIIEIICGLVVRAAIAMIICITGNCFCIIAVSGPSF